MTQEQTGKNRSAQSDFPEISVRQPRPFDIVDDPIEVSGISRAFEGTIIIRVRDENGQELATTVAQGGSMATFAKYRTEIELGSTPSTPQGSVEVFEESMRDGSELSKVTVPIVFGRNLLGREYYGFDIYEVKSGDSLSSIAKEDSDDAMTWQCIYEANRYLIDDPNLIYPGQVLRIPR